jgi:hypothetical protein
MEERKVEWEVGKVFLTLSRKASKQTSKQIDMQRRMHIYLHIPYAYA